MLRRDFLRGSASGILLANAACSSLLQRSRTSQQNPQAFSEFQILLGDGKNAVLASPSTGKFKVVEDRFGIHSFEKDPNWPETFLSIPKSGPSIHAIDFATEKIAHRFFAPNGMAFYGHGIWTSDGKQFYTGALHESGDGYLVTYSSEYKEIARHRITKGMVHDIRTNLPVL